MQGSGGVWEVFESLHGYLTETPSPGIPVSIQKYVDHSANFTYVRERNLFGQTMSIFILALAFRTMLLLNQSVIYLLQTIWNIKFYCSLFNQILTVMDVQVYWKGSRLN